MVGHRTYLPADIDIVALSATVVDELQASAFGPAGMRRITALSQSIRRGQRSARQEADLTVFEYGRDADPRLVDLVAYERN